MSKPLKISFVGSGVMAEAMIRGMLQEGLTPPDHLRCSDPQPARLAYLRDKYGVGTTQSNAEVAAGADVVVLSVKPQMFSEVSAQLQVPEGALILSIMAGVTAAQIVRRCQHPAVVRVMPNTPAQIGKGVSVWCATEAVNDAQHDHARAVLKALGSEHHVHHEQMLDMATALSGSAPAYVFLIMEALVDAGVHMGFSRQMAKDLVVQTVKGSAEFAEGSERHLADLRNMVTSPGGTTADAIYFLEKGGLRTVLSQAVRAAYLKSIQLSQLGDEPE